MNNKIFVWAASVFLKKIIDSNVTVIQLNYFFIQQYVHKTYTNEEEQKKILK